MKNESQCDVKGATDVRRVLQNICPPGAAAGHRRRSLPLLPRHLLVVYCRCCGRQSCRGVFCPSLTPTVCVLGRMPQWIVTCPSIWGIGAEIPFAMLRICLIKAEILSCGEVDLNWRTTIMLSAIAKINGCFSSHCEPSFTDYDTLGFNSRILSLVDIIQDLVLNRKISHCSN